MHDIASICDYTILVPLAIYDISYHMKFPPPFPSDMCYVKAYRGLTMALSGRQQQWPIHQLSSAVNTVQLVGRG